MYREEAQKPQWIKYLSKIYRPDRKFLDGSKKLSRSYRDTVQKARWIEYAIRSIKKRRQRGSIDANLLRICWEAVELEENEFFKERKNTKRWMQTSKLLKHRSNQHVKLSKTSLNKEMQSIHDPKHTRTLNKSNQFYISKTS